MSSSLHHSAGGIEESYFEQRILRYSRNVVGMLSRNRSHIDPLA